MFSIPTASTKQAQRLSTVASGLSKMAKQFETEVEWVWGLAQEREQ